MMRLLLLLLIVIVFPASAGAPKTNEPLQPLPEPAKVDQEKAALGKKLFHDKRLSKDKTISCASCHDLQKGGTDLEKVSSGVKGQLGAINAPTVFNSRHNFVQFWDGRAKDLKEQAAGPVTNPVEMGADWPTLIKRLKNDPEYVAAFKKLYGGKISEITITEAIAAFEETLDTPSRFDDYLKGNDDALTPKEKLGYTKFKQYGCIACHNGVNVGGGMYQKMGLVHDYFSDRGGLIHKEDLGRYNVTKNEAEKHFFKVPTLRNIALTPPYFHDARETSLHEVVRKMGYYQLGINIPKDDIDDIVAFLHSLTGKELEKK